MPKPVSRAELAPHCADVCLWRAGLSDQHRATIGDCPGTTERDDYSMGDGNEGFVQTCPITETAKLRRRMNGDDSVITPGNHLPNPAEIRRALEILYKNK